MAGHAQRLRLRLFIEGVEVPVIAAQVQSAPNSPGVASIQIPPLAEATRFHPRSLIHLFFLDFYESQSPLITTKPEFAFKDFRDPYVDPYVDPAGSVDAQNRIVDEANVQYKLLFGGELMGFQWTKNPTNRSIVLQCSDFSNYWDYAYQFNNTDLFGPGIKAIFAGGATNLFTDFLDDQGSVIARIIKTPSVQYPALKGLLGGIVHLLEAIGGSYYYDKKFAGQNIFFSLAELRLHITQMITAVENDPTASRLLNSGGFDGMFGRTLGNMGSQVSFRQAINALMGHIFHETYSIPTPLYVPGTGGTVAGFVRKKVRNDPVNSFIATTADSIIVSLQEIKTFVNDPNLTGSDRQLILRRLNEVRKTLQTTAQQIRALNVKQALSYYASAQSAIGVAITKVKAAGDHVSRFAKALQEINAKIDDAIAQMKRAADLEINITPQKKAIPARLNQQIFRPDVWFSAPPMCNVLFPENYTDLSYARMFMQEPTRLMLKTNDEFFGEDELFDNFYFAPKGFGLKTGKNSLSAILSNDLLDHELYTGILPVFEKMGELNIFAARSGTVEGKQPKVGLAQRSANFLYFKYRFAARQMQVKARFSPYIAPGFPGLVIDKYVDRETIERYNEMAVELGRATRDVNKLLGAHFLGNFTEVTHVVDQRNGRTEINCGYPRQPDESVEFLGAIEDGQTVKKRFDKDAIRTTDVASLNQPRLGAIGPSQGQITAVVEVTDIYADRGDAATSRTLPLYHGPRRQGTAESRVQVPVGISQPARDYGADVTALIGDNTRPVTFRAFRVTEDVPRYRKEIVDLPAEEYIRPGWYGDIWHPSKIGEAYRQLFRTGSITDPTQITDPSGTSTGVTSTAVDDAMTQASSATDAGDPKAQAPTVLTLDNNSSIEQAVAFLVLTYSYIKIGGIDPEEFVRAYTWRPIASMVDMFGTRDLQLSADGTQVLSGVEGFHSRAFGPFNDLFGLVAPEIESILGIKRDSTVAKKGDKRKDKQDRVLDYVAALGYARAILG